MISLKKNIVVNYLSQFYVTLIAIVMVPLYIRYMGAEAYGLIGFFATLQTFFNLLDLGMTPTLARETARFRGGEIHAVDYRCLVRALEVVFFVVALVGGFAMFVGSGYIAEDWLQISQLSVAEVQTAVQLMAIITALRWMGGLYRGVMSGSERFELLSGFNAVIATLRFVGVMPLLMFVGVTPTLFFSFQLAVAIIESGGLLFYAWRLLPPLPPDQDILWNWAPLKAIFKFSLSVAFTSSLWVLVTQIDKLLLSKLLSLQDYAYFTLAVLAASGVGLVSAPVRDVLIPRFVRLHAEGDEGGVIRLYRNSTQLVCAIVVPVALILACFGEQVVLVWTGDAVIAKQIAPVLMLYALGNGVLAIKSLGYFLQFAKGDLRLLLIETPIFLILFVPALWWSVRNYGVEGAGYSWLGTMVIFFVFWLPLIHRRFFTGQHVSWLTRDVGPVLSLCSIVLALSYGIVKGAIGWPEERISLALIITVLSLVSLMGAVMGSTFCRETLNRYR